MSSSNPQSYESFTAHLADREFFGIKLGLERMERLLARLGNPERRFRAVHIAGTNGKGSTAAMIGAILWAGGRRTGLYTSPHLVDFCERIRVGDEEIKPEEVLRYARAVREVEEEPLTFFELATAIAFLHFAEKRVEFAVLETGLGGRLDATNVMTPAVSVITSIGIDHTAQLGNTIESIALEKAGIIKPGIPALAGLLPLPTLEVIQRIASERRASLTVVDRPVDFEIPLAGEHQRRNAALAAAVARQLGVETPHIKEGLAAVSWPGRLETVQKSPWILLDGAHNPQAMVAVRRFLEPRLEGRRLKVLFGAMADKALEGLLSELAPMTDEFIFSAPRMKRAADPVRLTAIVAAMGKKGRVVPSVGEALASVVPSLKSDEVLLVTGSLFVVGEARGTVLIKKGDLISRETDVCCITAL